jgi:hypothetical protein
MAILVNTGMFWSHWCQENCRADSKRRDGATVKEQGNVEMSSSALMTGEITSSAMPRTTYYSLFCAIRKSTDWPFQQNPQ